MSPDISSCGVRSGVRRRRAHRWTGIRVLLCDSRFVDISELLVSVLGTPVDPPSGSAVADRIRPLIASATWTLPRHTWARLGLTDGLLPWTPPRQEAIMA